MLSQCCHIYKLWFKITPTKIENYVSKNKKAQFSRCFFEKFPLFSKNDLNLIPKSAKNCVFTPEIGKLKKDGDYLPLNFNQFEQICEKSCILYPRLQAKFLRNVHNQPTIWGKRLSKSRFSRKSGYFHHQYLLCNWECGQKM